MKRLTLASAVLIIALLSTLPAQSADKIKTNAGIFGNLNVNMHSPDFTLAGFEFNESGNSLGFSFGAIGNFPIDETFVISGRLGYNGANGVINGKNPLDVEGELEASLAYFEISPIVQFHNLLPVDDLYFLAGFEFGLPIQNEVTLSSEGLNEDFTGDITDESFRAAIALGAGYIIPLSDNIFLTPEISFRYPFTQVSGSDDFDSWNIPQLRLGASLTFGFTDQEPITEPERKSELRLGETTVRYYDREGNHYPLKRIRVEDIEYKEQFPLVPYVFYEEAQAEPIKEYQMVSASGEAGEFNLQSLEPDAININNKTLDIVGLRMRKNPGTKLEIHGTHDSKAESKTKELALKRAEHAKKYLMDNYGISADRIKTSAGLPDKPSSSRVDDGIAENRRVEFRSENDVLLQPIVVKEEAQSIADPNLIEFVADVSSNDSITSWKMEIIQADKTLRTYAGTGMPDPIQWVIYPDELKDSEIPVEYNLIVKNSGGLIREETGTIPIEYFSFSRKKEEDLPDKTISKFSLILFDFDKDVISDMDKQVIESMITPELKYNSTVKIYGYTDRIGDPDYNKKLALRRAEAVKKVLAEKASKAKFEVYGVGYNQGLFDNDSPIGRHLSRTVQIFIETPK